jgi:hypothetical protein
MAAGHYDFYRRSTCGDPVHVYCTGMMRTSCPNCAVPKALISALRPVDSGKTQTCEHRLYDTLGVGIWNLSCRVRTTDPTLGAKRARTRLLLPHQCHILHSFGSMLGLESKQCLRYFGRNKGIVRPQDTEGMYRAVVSQKAGIAKSLSHFTSELTTLKIISNNIH